MIRVVVVDDHPALRAGLQTVLDSEPGIVFVGESHGDESASGRCCERAAAGRGAARLPPADGDGLQLCYRIKPQSRRG